MKSFIPWIGGKTLLARKIRAEFPDNFGRYIEVFGGGGSVLFSADKHAKIEVYNDLNGDLVNLFRCIKYHRGELEREIDGYVNSREVFYDLRERLKCRGFTDIQRAAMFYVIIKLSYGADCKDYCCCTRTLDTSQFAQVSERIKNVIIENRDFEALIKQYDRSDAFFYCDPPYYSAERCYTNVFVKEDHYRLNNLLKALKGRFILSYNDDDFIRELYKDFQIIPIERHNCIKHGRFKEVIIKNF